MPKVGVVLSGCGVFDGSEVREAVLALLALDREGADIQCYAPDVPQLHVVDHLAGEPAAGEARKVLVEAARIARGDIKPLSEARAADCDAWIYPGGYGAAKNLCTFAIKGADCDVQQDAAVLIREAHAAGVPQCFLCISPALAARALQIADVSGVSLTIGDDAETASAIESMGMKHKKCAVDGCVVDESNRIVSTPAYMYGDARLGRIHDGIKKAVQATLQLVRQPVS